MNPFMLFLMKMLISVFHFLKTIIAVNVINLCLNMFKDGIIILVTWPLLQFPFSNSEPVQPLMSRNLEPYSPN